ncbi:hypothetical protein DSO57_1018706 [Entomophthora muscae]|uniref:Uncharacterized protein n=1 Tax=Entomophthora muscae TaxID=34485 RepID=A0ACC2UQV1_9FUNG|nr:hypothetical protein DSO57_1018706 [Entomophthora muscae]
MKRFGLKAYITPKVTQSYCHHQPLKTLKNMSKSYIVTFKESTSDQVVEAAIEDVKAKGGEIRHRYTLIKGFFCLHARGRSFCPFSPWRECKHRGRSGCTHLEIIFLIKCVELSAYAIHAYTLTSETF